MKKIITIMVLVLAAYSAFFWLFAKDKIVKSDMVLEETKTVEGVVVEKENSTENIDEKLCFSRTQTATEDAPYSIEEYIELNFNENMVSGIKNGTQNGPDMNNGYKGTLTGEKVNNLIGVIFSYTVEGSAQKEKEEYLISEESLTKQRYVLVEDGDLLVPDKTSDVSEIVYKKTDCK